VILQYKEKITDMTTPKETCDIILKAVGQQKHPAAELVALYLERWELEIRKDELNRRQIKPFEVV
tara:strand:+ start:1579 stop:1773 length:195 start_codon:yes stop_codon:yes gene_type:complete